MSAVEYYLSKFDSDFVGGRKIKKRISHPQVEPDPMAVLATTKPHRLKEVHKEISGWQDKSLAAMASLPAKPVENWTRLDLRRYVTRTYNNRWGDALRSNEHALINEIITRVEHCFRVQIKQEGNPILKEYFDYFIDKHVPSAAAEKGGMTWQKFAYQKFIISFVQYWQSKQPKPVVEEITEDPIPVVAPISEITESAVVTAYRKAPHVLVRDYGLIVTINYLMMVRGQTKDRALEYVRNAMAKVNIEDVVASTSRLSPYPQWLVFTDDKIVSELFGKMPTYQIAENSAFEFMRK